MKVNITRQYGFAHYWTLVVGKKEFYLGQDVKFCNRVLNMLPRDVVKAIGDNNIDDPKTNKKLARFIVQTLKEEHSIDFKKLQTWELCAE